RFLFEDLAIGRRVSLINEESGSKMIVFSGAAHPMVKLDITKGKANVEESLELDLAELIDVKGMRAQGNRLSTHEVQRIELLTTKENEDEVEDIESEENLDPQTESPAIASGEKKDKPKVDFEITNPDDIDMDVDDTG